MLILDKVSFIVLQPFNNTGEEDDVKTTTRRV